MSWKDPSEGFGDALLHLLTGLIGAGLFFWGLEAVLSQRFRGRRYGAFIVGGDAVLVGSFLLLVGFGVVVVVAIAWRRRRH
ncbi:MAG TPA: hypothetical protein VM328_02450 [Fimbriimonadaceae bacterium]|nr:hypothetical protein [Fimbriimonadaceae bacterium]